jgi:hypothetical protein
MGRERSRVDARDARPLRVRKGAGMECGVKKTAGAGGIGAPHRFGARANMYAAG